MASDCGQKPSELRVDGGASANQFLMQFQADVLGCKVIRPAVIETTALGAALLAGLAVGVWKNMDEIRRVWQVDLSLVPQMSEQERERRWLAGTEPFDAACAGPRKRIDGRFCMK